jgi:hypothetical protein
MCVTHGDAALRGSCNPADQPMTPSSSPGALKPPVFIGGTGRCGSTLLSRFMSCHPGLFCLRWESQFIVARDGLLDLVRADFSPRALNVFVERLRGRWFRRVLNVGKPNEYEAGLCHDISNEQLETAIASLEAELSGGLPDGAYRVAARFVDTLLSEPTRHAGANRWCEKTPRNSIYTDQLWKLFPGMKFVHIIRDGRDVVSSMLDRGFWPVAATEEFPTTRPFHGEVTFEKAVDYWVELLRLARRIAQFVPSTNYFEVRLEDLVNDPQREMAEIFAFIDEPLDGQELDFKWSDPHIGRWKNDLSAAQVAYLHDRAGAVLLGEGYSLSASSG